MDGNRKPLARARAFAKVNLTLRVLGVRPDRYHEVRTIYQALALHDTLIFSAHSGAFAIECNDPACPLGRDNLVWRAAELMWRAAGRRGSPAGTHVRLVKRIPMLAGLGGGSSDAAATLQALDLIWRIGATPDDLHGLARALGADVAFFLEGGTALGVGRGDLLYPLPDWPSTWVVLVHPHIGVRSKQAYAWWDRDRRVRGSGSRAATQGTAGSQESRLGPYQERGNDLQRAVATRHPIVQRLARELLRAGALYGAMSGSGSAVFGLFSSRGRAERAAGALEASGRQVVITSTLGRARYRALARPSRRGS